MNWLDTQVQTSMAALGWPLEAFVRLALAALAGALIGLEREIRGREAGFRTNLLVALGSALVMIVSIHFARVPWHPAGGFNITVDPARMAYGVMTGVGFLGAGAIIKQRFGVRGLTTAAGLWCVAATGLAAGLGLYLIVAVATLLVLMALWFLNYLEDMLPRQHFRVLTVRTAWAPGCVEQTVAWVGQNHIQVHEVGFQRCDDGSQVDVNLGISYRRVAHLIELQRRLQVDSRLQLMSLLETA